MVGFYKKRGGSCIKKESNSWDPYQNIDSFHDVHFKIGNFLGIQEGVNRQSSFCDVMSESIVNQRVVWLRLRPPKQLAKSIERLQAGQQVLATKMFNHSLEHFSWEQVLVLTHPSEGHPNRILWALLALVVRLLLLLGFIGHIHGETMRMDVHLVDGQTVHSVLLGDQYEMIPDASHRQEVDGNVRVRE